MSFERANVKIAYKPWGSHDLQPWSGIDAGAVAIGELGFDRADAHDLGPALLLKLLFAREPLSIQVHPSDEMAKASGMSNGKTEAWYVLSAEPGAQVCVGLRRAVTEVELRQAIGDGSICDLLQWHDAAAGDVFFIPSGTIHGIGAGLVIAEIQQRSDTTFRLFDPGHARQLHIEQAIAAANLEATKVEASRKRLTPARTQLVSCDFFVLELADLPSDSQWELRADRETWLLVTAGAADIGPEPAAVGDAFYVEMDRATITAGASGATILVAYAASVFDRDLLRDLAPFNAERPAAVELIQAMGCLHPTVGPPPNPVRIPS